MIQQTSPMVPPRFDGLRCGVCGNKELFVETMKYELHVVDEHLNYLHLLGAEADFYECYDCGELIEFDLDSGSK